MSIDVNRLLTIKNFKQFIETYEVNGIAMKRRFPVPKTRIAEHFQVSKTKLLKWMRENGFNDLIKSEPQQLARAKKERQHSCD